MACYVKSQVSFLGGKLKEEYNNINDNTSNIIIMIMIG